MVKNKKLSELSILAKNFRLKGKFVNVQEAEQEYMCQETFICQTSRIYIYLIKSPPAVKRISLF